MKQHGQLVRDNLDLEGADIVTLPTSLRLLNTLLTLDMSGCRSLTDLPKAMGELTSLKSLSLRECEKLPALPDSLSCLPSWEILDITVCSSVTSLPDSFGDFVHVARHEDAEGHYHDVFAGLLREAHLLDHVGSQGVAHRAAQMHR